MEKAIKELEDLFATTAKGNVVYFNDVTFTPIPRPVVEAVEAIASEYPDLRFQIGMYSVKVMEKEPITIQSSKKKEVESSKIGDIHDDYVLNKINESEVIENLKESGMNSKRAKELVKKWKPSVIKSALSDFFPVSEEQAADINELAETFVDKSELRNVLEDYFHIYDDYAEMSVQDFDRYLADYFDSEKIDTSI